MTLAHLTISDLMTIASSSGSTSDQVETELNKFLADIRLSGNL
jgi:hypothetical protein